jgi:hypothetical protein
MPYVRRVMVAAATAEQLIVSRNRTGFPIPSAPKQLALLPAFSPSNPKKAREERRALVAAAAPKDLAASRARLAARAAQGARERQRQRQRQQRQQRARNVQARKEERRAVEAAEQLAALAAGRPYMTREEQKRIAARNRKRKQRLREQNDPAAKKRAEVIAQPEMSSFSPSSCSSVASSTTFPATAAAPTPDPVQLTADDKKRIAVRNRKRNQKLCDQNDAETLKKAKALAEKQRDAYERKTRQVNHRKRAAVGAA